MANVWHQQTGNLADTVKMAEACTDQCVMLKRFETVLSTTIIECAAHRVTDLAGGKSVKAEVYFNLGTSAADRNETA